VATGAYRMDCAVGPVCWFNAIHGHDHCDLHRSYSFIFMVRAVAQAPDQSTGIRFDAPLRAT